MTAAAGTLHRAALSSPVGRLTLVAGETGLVAVLWPDDGRLSYPDAVEGVDHPVLAAAERQLREYFAGGRRTFDLPLDPRGTAFQRAVWDALLAIPYG